MSWIQFLFMALVAMVVTVPAVLFIPRARQSPAFDRLLWISTWVIAFLGAWAALGYIGFTPGQPLPVDTLAVLDLPALPVIAGAALGAFLLNAVLWVMDRLSHPAHEMEEDEMMPDDQPPLMNEMPPAEEIWRHSEGSSAGEVAPGGETRPSDSPERPEAMHTNPPADRASEGEQIPPGSTNQG